MGPDPEKTCDNSFERIDYEVNQELEDMDIDEDTEDNGYMRLNYDENEIAANDESSASEHSDDEDDFNFNDNVQQPDIIENAPSIPVPPIVSMDSELEKIVWTGSPSSDIQISSEKSLQITEIMSKITLPTPPPEWLNEINPSDIISRLQKSSTSKN
jgi:Male enhanced antigen 1 (MEA1)